MNWLLLRGLTREARHWGAFPARLADTLQLPAHAVHTPDLPGNGALHRQTSPAHVGAMVDALRQQLAAQGLAPPFAVAALSLGGMVAIDWARRFPHEVDRLVLINTSLRPHSGPTQRLRPAQWPTLAALAWRWRGGDAAAIEQTLHRLTCRDTTGQSADIAAWVHIRQDAPVSARNAGRQLVAAARFRCDARPASPTLVLSSAGDALVNPACSVRLACAWQAPHRIHPWAGHDLPHDDPAWVAHRIADWAGDLPPR